MLTTTRVKFDSNDEGVRFSNAFLVAQWGEKNSEKIETKGRRSSQVKNSGRIYKGISGRISKDGKEGWFDVDNRGRMICV